MIDLNDAGTQTVNSLARLRDPAGAPLLKFLVAQHESAKQKLVYEGDMASLHRLQGRAEAFEDLLRAVDDSALVLNRA